MSEPDAGFPSLHTRHLSMNRSARRSMRIQRLESRNMFAVGVFERQELGTPGFPPADLAIFGESLARTLVVNNDGQTYGPPSGTPVDIGEQLIAVGHLPAESAVAGAHAAVVASHSLTDVDLPGGFTSVPQLSFSGISTVEASIPAYNAGSPATGNHHDALARVDTETDGFASYIYNDADPDAFDGDGLEGFVSLTAGVRFAFREELDLGQFSHVRVYVEVSVLIDNVPVGFANFGLSTRDGSYTVRSDARGAAWVPDQFGSGRYVDSFVRFEDTETTSQSILLSAMVPFNGSISHGDNITFDVETSGYQVHQAGSSPGSPGTPPYIQPGYGISSTVTYSGVAFVRATENVLTREIDDPSIDSSAGPPLGRDGQPIDMDGDGVTAGDEADDLIAWQSFLASTAASLVGGADYVRDINGDALIDSADQAVLDEMFAEWRLSQLAGEIPELNGSRLLLVSNLEDVVDGDFRFGELSLREAIQLAGDSAQPGRNAIVFSPHLAAGGVGEIVLRDQGTDGLRDSLVIGSDLVISGPGADKLKIDAAGGTHAITFTKVLPTSQAFRVGVSGLTVEGAWSYAVQRGSGDHAGWLHLAFVELARNGGGVLFAYGQRLQIEASTISENLGSGIVVGYNPVTVSNTTVSENGGDGFSVAYASATITNATIYNNGGAGVRASYAGTVTLSDSIVASSKPNATAIVRVTGSYGGRISSASRNNLIGYDAVRGNGIDHGVNGNIVGESSAIDPRLLSLAYNGGPTRTHALVISSNPSLTSLAVDAGSVPAAGARDQRGLARQGLGDIGAFEHQVGSAL